MMKTSFRVALCVLIVFAIALAYGFQYFRMAFADSADYTEADKKDYDFYTPDLLKKLPRITDNYNFHYGNVSGPNPALIFQVRFIGVTETKQLNAFMKQNGYTKSEACSFAGDCWAGNDADVTVSIGIEEKPGAVLVTMVEMSAQSDPGIKARKG